jgi:hypothetical protein
VFLRYCSCQVPLNQEDQVKTGRGVDSKTPFNGRDETGWNFFWNAGKSSSRRMRTRRIFFTGCMAFQFLKRIFRSSMK